jgi:hypothetical protein
MPSLVTINGVQTRRPGVRAKVSRQEAAGVVSPTGRVVILEELPFLEKGVVTEVRSRRAMQDLAPWSDHLQNLAKVLFEPANDDRISGGPNAILLVSPTPTTAARATLLDANGDDSLLLEAVSWGTSGNRVKVAVTNNATDATIRDITLTWDGVSEPFTALGLGSLVSVYYGLTEATAVTLLADRINGVRVRQTKAAIAIGTYEPDKMAWDGTITVTPSAGAASAQTFTVTVSGTDKATGLAATEVLSWDDTDTTDPMTTAKSWSDVTSIVFAESGSTTPTFTVSAFAFDCGPSSYANLGLVADRINAKNTAGYYATKLSAKVASVPTNEIDTFAEASCLTEVAAKAVRADLWWMVTQLERSELVEVTRVTTTSSDGLLAPVALGAPVFLSGGTETTPVLANWQTCLDALQTERINSGWCGSTDAAVHDAVATHLAGRTQAVGANSADFAFGCAALETKAQIKTRTLALSGKRGVTLCVDKLRRRNAAGSLVWMDPKYQALEIVGMAMGTSIGEPQTRKYSAAVDIAKSFDPVLDAEEMLAAGVLFYEKSPKGIRCAASVSTYTQTDFLPFAERSANESFNYGLQLVADAWDVLIGLPNSRVTASGLKTLSRTVLRQAVIDGVIRWFDESTLDVTEIGDVFRLDARIAPVLPFNHGIIQAEAVAFLPTGAQ